MISDKVERQRVYLTYRKLFTGKNARVRKKKAILRIVQSSPTSEPLDEQHLKQKTIPILRSLLNDRVFEIEEAAKIDFPEVWTTSREENKLDETSIRATGASQAPAELNEAASNPNVASTPRDETNTDSFQLDAKHFKFSYTAQHQVLAPVQQMLETSCYNFTCEWFPTILDNRAWTCAAALELTTWLRIMGDRVDSLPEACMDKAGRATFKKIRPQLALLRHSAVHRLHLEHSAFLGQIHAALMLTEILRDGSSMAKLQVVYACLEGIVMKTKHDAGSLRQKVNDELLAMQKQREDLGRREQQLRVSAAKQISKISEEADRSLLGCIIDKLEASKLERGSGDDVQRNSDDLYVGESDIESDEDQLRAELE